MDRTQKLSLFRSMLTARQVDQVEQELTRRGEAFFHVSGAGHEASAVLAYHLNEHDWLHCHYRDKALMISRGISARQFLSSVLCKDESHSRGRQMSAHMSDRDLHILSITGPVGNSALHAVGVAQAVHTEPTQPIVLCSLGDGTTQEGEFLEACAEAVRTEMPVLFFVEDNHWAISTTTEGKTFYSTPQGPAQEFYGIPIHYVDGRSVSATNSCVEEVISQMRADRRPAIIVFKVERLTSHTNADDHSIYRSAEDIQEVNEHCDPIQIYERELLAEGFAAEELTAIRSQVIQQVADAERKALAGKEPQPTFTAKKQIKVELTHPSREQRGAGEPELTMKDAMREVLRQQLAADERVSLFGEDIEDPKGDVFGVTKGLSTAFPGRVQNSPLTESTIVGVSVGQAIAGQRPVAFLQFADFLPLAYNQIATELASMFWRTDGHWEAPVIIMIPCGGYRPGLGPFHSHSLESIAAHTPGVDVFMPSTAGDAAGLLNAAFKSTRPTLFFYPKSCLNDSLRATSRDIDAQFTPIGTSRKVRPGRDITFVGWGNTVRLCERAAEALEPVGVEAEVIDLRCLSPWDEQAVLASAERTARLIVVHEDNQTCGMGAEILATVAERTRVPVAMRRVTRPDTFIPCNFSNQIDVLPSFKRLMSTAAEMLNLGLSWTAPEESESGIDYIKAIGSGPSDETVLVVELAVKVGDTIQRGDVIASLEATKSVFDLTSSISGVIEEIMAEEGESIAVGQRMVRVRCNETTKRQAAITEEQCGTPNLVRRKTTSTIHLRERTEPRRSFDVGISSVSAVNGKRLVENSDLLARGATMTEQDILRRTGIQTRHWVDADQTAVSMAAKACWQLLERENLIIDDLDLVICSTTSPASVTPSMACRVLNELSGGNNSAMLQAYDINAACSGYLYALQAGYDYLQSMPHGRVLLVTAEVLSPLLDPNDFDTAILFGDATSASILYGEAHFEHAQARVYRPDLSARGEDGSSLSVPFPHDGFIQMKGRKIFSEAVRSMVASLNRACDLQNIAVDDLNLVVPHQANQRIIDAIQNRLSVEVYSNIQHYGNTSSSSIPLCLSDVLPNASKGEQIGLCAFGGGFTFGAGVLEVN